MFTAGAATAGEESEDGDESEKESEGNEALAAAEAAGTVSGNDDATSEAASPHSAATVAASISVDGSQQRAPKEADIQLTRRQPTRKPTRQEGSEPASYPATQQATQPPSHPASQTSHQPEASGAISAFRAFADAFVESRGASTSSLTSRALTEKVVKAASTIEPADPACSSAGSPAGSPALPVEAEQAVIAELVESLVATHKQLGALNAHRRVAAASTSALAELMQAATHASEFARQVAALHEAQASAQVQRLPPQLRHELSAGLLKLQLGASGENAAAGWLNVDGAGQRDDSGATADGTAPAQLFFALVGEGTRLPLPSASCRYICACETTPTRAPPNSLNLLVANP